MSTLNNRFQLALLKRKRSGNALQKGFTLVELMIVIVIVGILSAVALPNFLNQTEKAKATEAQSKIAAGLKQAQALYIEDATFDANNDCSEIGFTGTNPTENGWQYTCSQTGGVLSISATNSAQGITLSPGTLTYATGIITKASISG